MELLCPDCLAPLESADGRVAHCPTHGADFQILFTRNFAPNVEPEAPPVIPEAIDPGPLCVPETPLAPPPTGILLAPPEPETAPLKLSIVRPVPIAAPPLLPKFPPGVHCVQHQHLPAANQCKTCGAFMCQTCTFDLPGAAALCPECATSSKTPDNPRRKKIVVGSYVCAIWCTFMVAAISLGIFRGVARDPSGLMALTILISITLTIPSITGLALAVSALERRRPASIPIWLVIVWNGLFVARHIVLVLLNLLR